MLCTVRRLRKLGIDTTIDLEFFARSTAILGFLSGAGRRVGCHAFGGEGPYRGDLLTHKVRFNPHLHASQIFRMMVDAVDIPPRQLPTFNALPTDADARLPRFTPGGGEVEQVRATLAQVAGDGEFQPLILINPNCGDLMPLRRWPANRYVELARRLIRRYPELRVAITGSPNETASAAALAEQVGSDRCFNLAGRTTLRQLLVLYTLAEVLITNDSGPAHFASLTNIDVVALFGPEHPGIFAAQTPRSHVLWAGIVCSPCVSALNNRTSACRDNVCMQRISVDQVFEQVSCVYEHRMGGGHSG
jgi:ADP-heptose:LPS heptosyltransferase